MSSTPAKTFLVAHGAWGAGWSWKRMHPALRARGHELYTPTYTGLGERAHLMNRSIDLQTHVQDVVAVLEYEDLRDVVLLGHSYGGMVATGVVDRVQERIAQLIWICIRAPRGQSLLDLLPEAERERRPAEPATAARAGGCRRSPAAGHAGGGLAWLAARRGDSRSMLRDQAQVAWRRANVAAQLYLRHRLRRTIVRAVCGAGQAEAGWRYFEIDASHSPNVTAPER